MQGYGGWAAGPRPTLANHHSGLWFPFHAWWPTGSLFHCLVHPNCTPEHVLLPVAALTARQVSAVAERVEAELVESYLGTLVEVADWPRGGVVSQRVFQAETRNLSCVPWHFAVGRVTSVAWRL